MKCFGLFLLLFILCSCMQHTKIRQDIKQANDAIITLEKSLPDMCKTPEINAKIEMIRAKIQQVETRCETQIELLTSEKNRWRTMFYCMAIIVGLYIAKRLIK